VQLATTPVETNNEYGLFWWLETLSGSQAFAAEGQGGSSSRWCLNSDADHRNRDADMWLVSRRRHLHDQHNDHAITALSRRICGTVGHAVIRCSVRS
jgi:hypothetical protein